MDSHETSTCLTLLGLTPATRHSKEQKHEYGLLGAAVYMMLPIEREFICQLALPWGTRHLISPELAGKDVLIHHQGLTLSRTPQQVG